MRELTIDKYMLLLSSAAPVPGGGGASAIGAALGAGLCNMVGSLTVGKKKYAEYEDEIQCMLEQGRQLQQELLVLSEKDAEVFAPLAALYALPKDTPEQAEYRKNALSEASKAAAQVPLDIAETALRSMYLCRRIAETGSKLAVSDAGCSIIFLRAALRAALYNVRINLPLILDEAFVSAAQSRMSELTAEAAELEAQTAAIVDQRL